ncbi:pyroglutamyl-peptidase I [Sporosarcina pasteurii]|uniref:Pyrrolidone-carboxylate peptidase n=1 Tax=Sporosarcina pasteurii TaxID=1474 RepID=A0A380BBX8_SPOPA|nr:pyroglutamyl-peptidase I [Sporosarcina pasteurii]MDS9472370.1 pyroglutamyl-peptidase I [Sporosarcina pasteurii]QBQ06348.1 pyroglutamyl-peptidase I [Sporosarcina pasteurii]SUI98917.1 Pyrrolidone-carboxylate peptidase [Sporosarcina pasteurii]
MKKLLLTGFEPFLKFSLNPTMKIVEALHGMEIGQYVIHSEVLPVEFEKSGPTLMNHIEKIQPDAIISLGLAGGRSKITPERIAINVNDGPKDNSGYAPVDEVIIEGGADGYFSTLPIREMVETLNDARLPAKISNTAGAYLCNNVMYRALHYANKQQTPIKAGFIHIPASHELAIEQGAIPSWSEEDLKNGVLTCIRVLAEE